MVRLSRPRGFTLIELLVVIVIIAILICWLISGSFPGCREFTVGKLAGADEISIKPPSTICPRFQRVLWSLYLSR